MYRPPTLITKDLSSIGIKEVACIKSSQSSLCSGHTQPESDSDATTDGGSLDRSLSSSSSSCAWEGGREEYDSHSIVSSICDNNSTHHHNDCSIGFVIPPSQMDNILPPLRPLTDEEHSHIFLLLHGILNFENAECQIQAERDAADMITYTCEMIDAKMRVGYIIEEMDFMDLDICSPTTVLIEMRKCLAVYLSQLEEVHFSFCAAV